MRRTAAPRIEPVGGNRYRILFDRPLDAAEALMYFGFYPDTELYWKQGKVVSVIASASTYERIVHDFSEGKTT